jgi:hypothetical protein
MWFFSLSFVCSAVSTSKGENSMLDFAEVIKKCIDNVTTHHIILSHDSNVPEIMQKTGSFGEAQLKEATALLKPGGPLPGSNRLIAAKVMRLAKARF